MAMKAVFGLGNPGDRYALTRHNVGARAVLAYIQGHRPPPRPQEEGFSIVYPLSNHLCVLPQTYMNLSGIAYVDALEQFGLDASQCLA
ncbi:MAG TPA: aminoacyl-tRNA hydrolase, partial [Candidatus Bipolaricaulota bacterium]